MGYIYQPATIKFVQETPSSVWTITHNLGVSALAVDVWIETSPELSPGLFELMIPAEVNVLNPMQVEIRFSKNRVGYAIIK